MSRTASTSIFDAAFLRRIECFRQLFRSGLGGRQALSGRLTSRPGGEVEFLKHRPYSPGDDLRRCDWKAFMRTGKPYLREFAREEILAVRVMLDASASMAAGEPPAFYTARRVALLFMGVLRESEEPLEIAVVSGDGVKRLSAAGKQFGKVINFMEALYAQGRGAGVSGATLPWVRRLPGVTMYISDFYPEASGLLAGERPRFIRPGGKERLIFMRIRPRWRLPAGFALIGEPEATERIEARLPRRAEGTLETAESRIEAALAAWAGRAGAAYVSIRAGADEFEVAGRLFGVFGISAPRLRATVAP